MEFKFIKELKDEKNIEKFEIESGMKLSKEYREFIKKYNGSRPSKKAFKTISGKEHLVKSFLSFNEEDKENVFSEYKVGYRFYGENYCAVANDSFGNYILRDNEEKIYYFAHETGEIELIANSFANFIALLEE